MAYIGQGIKNGTFAKLDTSGNTYNGSNVTFALGTQVGSPVQLLVSHDGVIQNPGTDYTLASNGTQITFTTAPASGAAIFIMEISGAVGGPMNRDINGEELILDVDGDTSITADTDDQIDIKVAGTDQLTIKDGALSPVTDNDVDLGTTSLEFKDGYFDGTLHCDVLDLAGTEYTSISSALDDIATGDAASTLATSAGNITIDAQGDDTDIIFKGTDGGADTTFLTIDGSAAGASAFNSYITSTAIYGKGDGNTGIQFEGSDVITIHTGGTERMRFLANGHSAIGSTASESILNVDSTGNQDPILNANTSSTSYDKRVLVFSCSRDSSNNSYKLAQGRNGGGERFHIKDSGNVANTNNNYGSLSDSRVKQDIDDASSQWNDIKALKIRKYKLKKYVNKDGADNTPYHLGVIAQELEASGMNGLVDENNPEKEDVALHSDFGSIDSEDVFTAGQNKKEVKYSILYMKAIKALQEAMAKIESLEARVTTLEG